MKGFIVVHGTSQDIMSTTETTVQLAKAAQAAGHQVVQIGGPGSTERAILRGLERDPSTAEYSRIEDIGFPLDYGWDVLAGTATGAGMDGIVNEIRAAALKMLKSGVTSINLVGFSRGAVSLALALQRIGEEMGTVQLPVPIKVCLMDPVPGPYLVPKTIKIPSFVDSMLLLISKHEGRPGFRHLDLIVSPEVKFRADLVMGVHGDIGGSTQSAMTTLIKDEVSQFVGLAALRLSPEQRFERTLQIIANPRPYTFHSFAQMMARRAIGWSGFEGAPDTIELPSAHAVEDLELIHFPHDDDESRQFLRREIRRAQQPPTFPMIPQVTVPARPIVNQTHQVIYPPSYFMRPTPRLWANVQRGLRMFPK